MANNNENTGGVTNNLVGEQPIVLNSELGDVLVAEPTTETTEIKEVVSEKSNEIIRLVNAVNEQLAKRSHVVNAVLKYCENNYLAPCLLKANVDKDSDFLIILRDGSSNKKPLGFAEKKRGVSSWSDRLYVPPAVQADVVDFLTRFSCGIDNRSHGSNVEKMEKYIKTSAVPVE